MVISVIVDMHFGWTVHLVGRFLYKITILCDLRICKYYLTNINSYNYVDGIILNQMIPLLCICDNKCEHSININMFGHRMYKSGHTFFSQEFQEVQ